MNTEWTNEQIVEAGKAWADLGGDEAKIRAALDKGVKLTTCTDEAREAAIAMADEMGVSLEPVKSYAAARDIDRIYLASKGPDNTSKQVRELVRRLKDENGMNANQVAAAIGIPPRFINGMYAAAVKAQAADAKPEAVEVG